MSWNRWKVLACTLTVGVGGLAVFATPPATDKAEPPKEPAPLPKLTAKPESPVNGSDTPDPIKPAKGEVFDLDIPIPATPTNSEEPKKKPAEVIVVPPAPLILPVSGDDQFKAPIKPDDKSAAPPLKIDPPKLPAKSDDKRGVVPPPSKIDSPIIPKEISVPSVPSPMPEVPKPSAVKPPAVDVSPLPPVAGDAPSRPHLMPDVRNPPPEPTAKLKLLLRMGDGQPRFEIRNIASTELLLKVYGERIDMQSPPDQKSSSLVGVSAAGHVRFTAPGIEGTCDQLTILSATGEVLLKGNIHLKSKNGKGWSEMTAEKMVYQIGTSGIGKPAGSRTTVTPAGYIPD